MKLVTTTAIAIVVAAAVLMVLHRNNLDVLNPAGSVAEQQRNLFIFTCLLSLLVVIPVFTLTAWIAIRYRRGNKKAKYMPDWDHNNLLETIWWGIPGAIILVLAVVTWNSTHALDPYRPLDSTKKPLTIQVVALEWKWLFIYPEQKIATVNHVQFPKDTPINFVITSDAPMNSFWIPKLGGQVYAMTGMKTKLHLEANKVGVFEGRSANLSGEGFAGMHFTAKSTDQRNFDKWLEEVVDKPDVLTLAEYKTLAKPGETKEPLYFSAVEDGLFDAVVNQYMSHGSNHGGSH